MPGHGTILTDEEMDAIETGSPTTTAQRRDVDDDTRGSWRVAGAPGRRGWLEVSTEKPEYADEYPTCARTFATLGIYPESGALSDISEALGLLPSQTTSPTDETPAVRAGWFLTSESIDSRDLRRHLDWLIALVEPRAEGLHELQRQGMLTIVSCYWLSAHGHGGPVLSPAQMLRLGTLGLECQVHVYCATG